MKERPILFSSEMIRAILEGRKTMTRRVVKDISSRADGEWHPFIGPNDKQTGEWFFTTKTYAHVIGQHRKCPYGKPGDRLWVRETWSWIGNGFSVRDLEFLMAEGEINLIYKADDRYGTFAGPWTPSIHMPRWASRILLEVVSVRVERVQDISEADALAEGCVDWVENAADAFHDLWESINGKDPEKQWGANPWVWVIEFKRVQP